MYELLVLNLLPLWLSNLARTYAPGASSSSNYVLLNAISSPTKQSLLHEPDVQILDLVLASPS
jgi:hypothetical protein